MDSTDNFSKSGYILIRNMIDISEVERLYKYTLENIDRGNLDDGQVIGSPAFYQDKEMALLQNKLLPKFEEAINLKLFSSFCYHRIYRTNAVLRAHKDRRACEISVSLNFGQKGEPWDLWLLDFNENAQRITFSPGDAVIYRGSKLLHWRGKLVNADFVSQVFLHFVDQNSRDVFRLKTELLNKSLARFRKMFGITY